MSDTTHPSNLEAIEAEVERDRRALVETVDTLRERVGSPAGMRGYVTGKRRGVTSSLERRLRENPLQTTALAVGAAYPLVRLAGRIPAPILLLGAGLALARKGNGVPAREVDTQSVARTQSATAPRTPSYPAVSHRSAAKEGVPAFTGDTRSAKSGLAAQAALMPGEPAGRADRKFENTPSENTWNATRAAGADAIDEVTDTARRLVRAGGEGFAETTARHPLAVGGVTLLAGAALALLLPRSTVEDALVGETSDMTRDRARRLAEEGLASGRRVLDATLKEAEDQGLTGEGASRTIEKAGNRVADLVDDAAEDIESAARKSAG